MSAPLTDPPVSGHELEMKRLEKGDIVRYQPAPYPDLKPGNCYRVSGTRPGCISLRNERDETHDHYAVEHFERVADSYAYGAAVFRAGERVRCVSSRPALTVGKVYVVDSIEVPFVRVVCDDGKINGWMAHVFELVEEPSPSPAPVPAVGSCGSGSHVADRVALDRIGEALFGTGTPYSRDAVVAAVKTRLAELERVTKERDQLSHGIHLIQLAILNAGFAKDGELFQDSIKRMSARLSKLHAAAEEAIRLERARDGVGPNGTTLVIRTLTAALSPAPVDGKARCIFCHATRRECPGHHFPAPEKASEAHTGDVRRREGAEAMVTTTPTTALAGKSDTICGAIFISPVNQSSVCMLPPGHKELHEYATASELARGLHQTRVLLEWERGATTRLLKRIEDLKVALRALLDLADRYRSGPAASIPGAEEWYAVRDTARAALEDA